MDIYFCMLGVVLIVFIGAMGYYFVAREEWKYKREYNVYSVKYKIITNIIKSTIDNDLNCEEAINKLYDIVEHEIY